MAQNFQLVKAQDLTLTLGHSLFMIYLRMRLSRNPQLL